MLVDYQNIGNQKEKKKLTACNTETGIHITIDPFAAIDRRFLLYRRVPFEKILMDEMAKASASMLHPDKKAEDIDKEIGNWQESELIEL